MILYLIFLSLFSFGNSKITYPSENSDLYIHDKYNISWDGNLTNFHIYLLHENENPLFTSSLSTFENGDLVLDDILEDNYYEWHIPRDLNYYDLEEHSFRIMIANNPMFSSSLSSNDNFFLLSDRFNIISNMNITNPEENYVVIPGKMVKIVWNGFLGDIDIILEYDNNGWKEYGKLENSFSTHQRNEYNWLVPMEINDLSDYQFRIKLKEKETGIYRYSKNFKSYGIELIEPRLQKYDFLSRDSNKLNISWIEKNNVYGNKPNIKLLNTHNETIKIFDMGVENIYNWELRYEDYNKNYRVEIENYNVSQISNLFLINHLTTTLTSTWTTTTISTTTTSISTTTTTKTSTTTTSISSTTTTKTTSTTTTTSDTLSTTTVTSSTISTFTITSNTQTNTTITSKTTSTRTNTYTSATNNYVPTNTVTTYTKTGKPLIIEDKIPSEETKKKKLDLVWIILISIFCLFIIILFIIYLKIYNKSTNKICDIQENQIENRGIENPMYEKENDISFNNRCLQNQNYGNFIPPQNLRRVPNPLYNKGNETDHYSYLSRLVFNNTYVDYTPNNTNI